MSSQVHEGDVAQSSMLSAEERAFRASLEGLVDFYRVEQTSALLRAFLPPAFIFLPLGSVLTALAINPRFVSGPLQGWCVLGAVLVTAMGPLWAIVSLLRSIRSDDRYLAIFVDGLRVRLDAERAARRISWQELTSVECDGQVLRLWVQSDAQSAPEMVEITSRFAELSLPALAARVRHGRRLGVWGRLTRAALLQVT